MKTIKTKARTWTIFLNKLLNKLFELFKKRDKNRTFHDYQVLKTRGKSTQVRTGVSSADKNILFDA
jgi:hypothetical protein